MRPSTSAVCLLRYGFLTAFFFNDFINVIEHLMEGYRNRGFSTFSRYYRGRFRFDWNYWKNLRHF